MAKSDRASVKTLPGAHRAAILVMYLEPRSARALLAHMQMDELEAIARAMADVEQVDSDVVEAIVGEFVSDLTRSAGVPSTGREFAFGVLPDLLDEKRGPVVIGRVRRDLDTTFRDLVASRPVSAVVAILREEHPQTRALALVLMGADTASHVLTVFDEDERLDLSMRMARLERVPSDIVDEVEKHLLSVFGEGAEPWAVAGIDRAAQTLGRLGRPVQDPLMSRIAEDDLLLSETLRRRMLVFADLVDLADKSIQAVLKAVDRQQLLIALRGADAAVREKFFKNMSSRASADLREEIAILGPMPRADVNNAQEEIVQTVVRLAGEGLIRLPSAGGDLV